MLCANEEDKRSVGNPPQVRNTDREQRRASGHSRFTRGSTRPRLCPRDSEARPSVRGLDGGRGSRRKLSGREARE